MVLTHGNQFSVGNDRTTDDPFAPMSRKSSFPSRERRIRRVCVRLDLHLMTPVKPDKLVLAHGGYMLRDAKTMKIVLGDKDYLFSADIDEVEAFIDERIEASAKA
jgi:hypothetical protein